MNRYVEGVKNRGLFVKTPKKKAKVRSVPGSLCKS